MASLSERKAHRQSIMQAVYDLTGGSTMKSVNVAELASELGISPEDMRDALDYLLNEGELKQLTMGTVELTHHGLVKMESEDDG
ncbi:hypothetical protein [Streptomyces sp. BH055]|uniref:hypothetical protein n=1 Tax=Streptomyces sp. BH055 TaxID=3401173 RepID=UPI003BB58933